MSKKILYKGEWFLPDDENHKIKGELTIDDKSKIKLELYGSFKNSAVHNFIEPEHIFGLTQNNELFTLIDCYQTSHSLSSTSFMALSTIKGVHLTKETNQFAKAYIISNCIDHFMDRSMFHFDRSDKIHTETKIISKEPFEKEIAISNDLKIYLRTYNSQSFTKGRIELIRKSNILFKLSQPLTIEGFIKKILHTLHFFSILSNQRVSGLGIVFYEPDGQSLKEFNFFTRKYSLLSTEKENPKDFILKYKELEDEIGPLISKWFEDEEKIDSLSSLLINSCSDSSALLESKFLNLCQFLELFHKVYRHNNVSEEKSKRLTESISDCREGNKDWLKNVLSGVNYPSFKERISELIEEGFENTLLKTKINETQKGQIANKIKWSRDYYTHYNKDLDNKRLKGEELLDLEIALRVLATFLLLKQLGISAEKLNKYFTGRSYIFN